MPQAPQPPQSQDDFTLKTSVNLLLAIAHTHAACLTPFLRHSFGRDQPGLFGAVGFLAMLFYAESQRDRFMVLYAWLWLAVLIFHRLGAAWRSFRGQAEHSYYPGYPLAMAVPFVTRESTARAFEPLLCLLAGQFLLSSSVPLGQFVMAGAVSLTVVELANRQLRTRRLIAMRNAEIEMRHLAAAHRRGGF